MSAAATLPDREGIAKEIIEERYRQGAKFGDQHGMGRMFMLTVLGEEFGEACQAALFEDRYTRKGPRPSLLERGLIAGRWRGRLRTELIQVAAVAMQIIEHIDGEDGGV